MTVEWVVKIIGEAFGPNSNSNGSNSSVTIGQTQPRVMNEPESTSSTKSLPQRDCITIDDKDDEAILYKAAVTGIVIAIGLGVVFYHMKGNK